MLFPVSLNSRYLDEGSFRTVTALIFPTRSLETPLCVIGRMYNAKTFFFFFGPCHKYLSQLQAHGYDQVNITTTSVENWPFSLPFQSLALQQLPWCNCLLTNHFLPPTIVLLKLFQYRCVKMLGAAFRKNDNLIKGVYVWRSAHWVSGCLYLCVCKE